jgi:hypothetical protein
MAGTHQTEGDSLQPLVPQQRCSMNRRVSSGVV